MKSTRLRSITPERRSQKERSTETQARLIGAAIELLHESGFSRLTIADVAHRAGLTTGAIQHHFPSRHALIKGVVDAVYPVLHIGVDQVDARRKPVPERVDLLVDAYWSIYRKSEYVVFWELVFGTRELPEFRDYLRSLQKDIAAGAVTGFVRLFSDIDMTRKRAKELFVFLTCQLRGLALLAFFEEAPTLEADLALLRKATRHLIAQRDGAETSPSRPGSD